MSDPMRMVQEKDDDEQFPILPQYFQFSSQIILSFEKSFHVFVLTCSNSSAAELMQFGNG